MAVAAVLSFSGEAHEDAPKADGAQVVQPGQEFAQSSKNMEKKNYYCEYCGRKFPSILTMVATSCNHHPKGSPKGNHSPAL